MAEEKDFESSIETLLAKIGLSLLEFSVSRHKGSVAVKAVVYASSGTGTEECAKAYRLILPQVQLVYGTQNPTIEVSSPGIDRIIKHPREWKAFLGKRVKILLAHSDDWISGTLKTMEEGKVSIEGAQGLEVIELASIQKARLDASGKGE
jgi:ribosome maturation factor RimP